MTKSYESVIVLLDIQLHLINRTEEDCIKSFKLLQRRDPSIFKFIVDRSRETISFNVTHFLRRKISSLIHYVMQKLATQCENILE